MTSRPIMTSSPDDDDGSVQTGPTRQGLRQEASVISVRNIIHHQQREHNQQLDDDEQEIDVVDYGDDDDDDHDHHDGVSDTFVGDNQENRSKPSQVGPIDLSITTTSRGGSNREDLLLAAAAAAATSSQSSQSSQSLSPIRSMINLANINTAQTVTTAKTLSVSSVSSPASSPSTNIYRGGCAMMMTSTTRKSGPLIKRTTPKRKMPATQVRQNIPSSHVAANNPIVVVIDEDDDIDNDAMESSGHHGKSKAASTHSVQSVITTMTTTTMTTTTATKMMKTLAAKAATQQQSQLAATHDRRDAILSAPPPAGASSLALALASDAAGVNSEPDDGIEDDDDDDQGDKIVSWRVPHPESAGAAIVAQTTGGEPTPVRQYRGGRGGRGRGRGGRGQRRGRGQPRGRGGSQRGRGGPQRFDIANSDYDSDPVNSETLSGVSLIKPECVKKPSTVTVATQTTMTKMPTTTTEQEQEQKEQHQQQQSLSSVSAATTNSILRNSSTSTVVVGRRYYNLRTRRYPGREQGVRFQLPQTHHQDQYLSRSVDHYNFNNYDNSSSYMDELNKIVDNRNKVNTYTGAKEMMLTCLWGRLNVARCEPLMTIVNSHPDKVAEYVRELWRNRPFKLRGLLDSQPNLVGLLERRLGDDIFASLNISAN